jgi:hypothetical protein
MRHMVKQAFKEMVKSTMGVLTVRNSRLTVNSLSTRTVRNVNGLVLCHSCAAIMVSSCYVSNVGVICNDRLWVRQRPVPIHCKSM